MIIEEKYVRWEVIYYNGSTEVLYEEPTYLGNLIQVVRTEHFNGRYTYHNLKGPAVLEIADGNVINSWFWIKGEPCTEEYFNARISKLGKILFD